VFARQFLSRNDVSFVLPREPTPSLCDRCTGMNIWSSGFYRGENVVELKARARSCKLCGILVDCLAHSGEVVKDVVPFYRSGSSLKLNLSGPSILSIYIPPGTYSQPPFRLRKESLLIHHKNIEMLLRMLKLGYRSSLRPEVLCIST
jgi:hypothetical protein